MKKCCSFLIDSLNLKKCLKYYIQNDDEDDYEDPIKSK